MFSREIRIPLCGEFEIALLFRKPPELSLDWHIGVAGIWILLVVKAYVSQIRKLPHTNLDRGSIDSKMQ